MRNHLDAILRQRAEAAKRIWPDPTAKTVHTEQRENPEFVKAVVAQAGGTCEHISNGHRCSGKTDLKVINWRPGSKDPKNGSAFCPPHHDLVQRGGS